MGSRGPAATPTALKILRGNPGHRSLNKDEPKPTAGVPTAPKFLDAEAKAEWKRVVAELAPLRVLTKVDRGFLAAYCESWSAYVRACKRMALGADRTTRQDRREAQQGMLQFGTRLGLSPADRTKLHTLPERKGDGKRRFFKGRDERA